MTFSPNSQPRIDLPANVGYRRQAPSQTNAPQFELIESLMYGLHITQLSLDFVHEYKHPEPVFGAEVRSRNNKDILGEAHRTMSEFNYIAWRIGGIPVRLQHQPAGLNDGRITHIENYEAGAWVLNFKMQQHGEAREVRGDTLALRSWYHATVPKELIIERSIKE